MPYFKTYCTKVELKEKAFSIIWQKVNFELQTQLVHFDVLSHNVSIIFYHNPTHCTTHYVKFIYSVSSLQYCNAEVGVAIAI